MKSLPDKVFDLIVTDQPYGLGIAKNPVRQKFERKDWDNATPDKEVFEQMFRVSKNQIIWGGNYFPLPPHKNFLIWDKIQPENFSLAICEMAWTSFDMPAKIFRYSVQREGANIHPTQKPVALMRWCIAKFGKAGQVVFDPFMGSGTTGVAALELGLSFVGCEIDTEYFEIAEKRMRQASLQQGLFNSTNRHIRQNAVTQPTFEGFASQAESL
jgi:DNA modification methylase